MLNGLGSAVSEVVGENYPVPIERIGIHDTYGEVGSVDYLQEKYGLNDVTIIEKVEKIIKRKEKILEGAY